MSSIVLNDEQRRAVELCLQGMSVFITGQAGTGKSVILQEMFKLFVPTKLAITSTTGVSAVQINGRTLHSWAGIGLAQQDRHELYKKVMRNRSAKNRWICVETLVIDEISLLSAELFDKLEYIARMTRRDKRPFGGIQLILTGDFYQLPVIGSQKFCFEAVSWTSVIKHVIHLTNVMRQSDKVFCKILEELRIGVCSDVTYGILKDRVRPWKLPSSENSAACIEPTRLFSKNNAVNRINNEKLAGLIGNGNEYVFYKTYLELKKKGRNADSDLNNIGNLLVESKPDVTIAIGTQVILSWNISVDNGLANGSRGVVVRFFDDNLEKLPVVRFLNGAEHVISRVISKYDSDGMIIDVEFMPLMLGWATSIHMSQGSTLDYVVTSLSTGEIWEYGQAYVAVSRVKTLDGLFLEKFEPEVFFCNPRVTEYYMNISE